MFQNNTSAGFNQRPNEEIKEGNYFIVDWICANPMNPTRGVPTIVAGNVTLEEAERIIAGHIIIEDVRTAAKQRVLCKVIKVANIKE